MKHQSPINAEALFLMAVEGATWAARVKHKSQQPTLHHGYAVMLEEMEEFWDEVKKKAENRNPNLLLHELIDLAASCVRTATEVVMTMMDSEEAVIAMESRSAGLPEGNLKLDIPAK